MARPRKSGSTLPPSYFPSHGAVYHVVKGKWRWVGTEADAHREYADRIQQDGEGELSPILEAAYLAVKAQPRPKPWAANTIEQYDGALKKIKRMLRQFSRPEQVKQKDAAQVKVLLSKTPNMANRCISLARQLFNHLVEQQVIESNPFLGVKRWREKKRTRLISWEEWHRIRAVAPRRLQLVMDGLYLTDRRIEDLLHVDERDALEQGVYFDTSKTDKELIIAWNEDLRRWWEECRALHGKVVKVNFEIKDRPRPLFRTRHGRRPAYKTVYDQWVKAVARAGVEDCNLHDNRAFSATEMKRQAGGGEAGEQAAQRLLGHEQRRTTKIYLRGREVEVVEGPRMQRILGA